ESRPHSLVPRKASAVLRCRSPLARLKACNDPQTHDLMATAAGVVSMTIAKPSRTRHAPSTRRDASVALVVLISAASVRAQQRSMTTGSIEELVRTTAERFAQTAADDGQSASATTISLTVNDAVKMALDKNLDIAVQRLNPQVYDL